MKMSFSPTLLSALMISGLLMVGCTRDKKVPNVELLQDMMEQPSVAPQKEEDFFDDHISERVPPEGTKPRGFTPYAFATDIAGADKNLNPLAGDVSEPVLLTGQKYFETNCMVCHGMKGTGSAGHSPISAKFPVEIPSLMSAKVRGLPDGHIYHIITMGQGVMGPYASHIPQAYRWQVVSYIRSMQKNSAVTGDSGGAAAAPSGAAPQSAVSKKTKKKK